MRKITVATDCGFVAFFVACKVETVSKSVQARPSVPLIECNDSNGFLCLSKSVQVRKNVGKTLKAISSQVPLTTQPPFRYVVLIS